MKPGTELHQLIRAMTMNEKRHFRLLSSRHGSDGNHSYLALFDQIASMEEYDETKLKAGHDKTGLRRFASEKNYLHQQVLDSLLHFHRNLPSARTQSLLTAAEILYEKKMFGAALRLIRKGKKENLHLEKLLTALPFMRWEASLLTVMARSAELANVFAEERNTLLRAQLQAEVMQGVFSIRALIEAGKVNRVKLEQITSAMRRVVRKAEKDNATTFLLYYYFYSGLSLYAGFLQHHHQRKENYVIIHTKLRNSPWLISDIPHIYHNNLNNIVNSCIFLGQFDEALNWIDVQRNLMKDFGLKNEALSARIFINTQENELFINSKLEHYQTAVRQSKIIEQAVRKFGAYYQGEQYDLFLSLSVLLYGGGEFREAARWLNRIIALRTDFVVRAEVQDTARLLLLIIYAESHDTSYANRRRSIERWLANRRIFNCSDLVLRFVRTLHERENEKEKRVRLNQLSRQFQKRQQDPSERLLCKYFDFGAWMKKRIHSFR